MWFREVSDLRQAAAAVRRARCGRIAMADQRFVSVQLRPWPKLVSLPEVWWGRRFHQRHPGDNCWLYYHQPWRLPNFLALTYVVSGGDATLGTFHGALVILDEIARLKQSDAIVCDVTNRRISDRLLSRWGWEPHVLHSRRRHFIKRFYGVYPECRLADYGVR